MIRTLVTWLYRDQVMWPSGVEYPGTAFFIVICLSTRDAWAIDLAWRMGILASAGTQNPAKLGPRLPFPARWQKSTSWQFWAGWDPSPIIQSFHSLKLNLPAPLGASFTVTVRFEMLGWGWRITVAIAILIEQLVLWWCWGGDGVCSCGEVAILLSEALFLVITLLSVCVQVGFMLGMGYSPSGSLQYLQRRCPLWKYMMGWYILGVLLCFLLLMIRMNVLMMVIASSRTDCIWSYFVKWFRCDVIQRRICAEYWHMLPWPSGLVCQEPDKSSQSSSIHNSHIEHIMNHSWSARIDESHKCGNP